MLAELLETASSSPHDDAPLLVLADQLLEQGSTQGELIHLQCKRAKLAPDHPDRAALLAREKALIAADSAKWLGPAFHPLVEFEFVRGVPTGRFGHHGLFLSELSGADTPHPSRTALRIYSWGWAFTVSVVAHGRVEVDLARWFDRKHPNLSRGAVTPSWTESGLSVAFDQTDSYGTVKYAGTLRDGVIEYESHSLINGYRGQGRFTLMPCDCDTRPSFEKPDESTWDGRHDGHY